MFVDVRPQPSEERREIAGGGPRFNSRIDFARCGEQLRRHDRAQEDDGFRLPRRDSIARRLIDDWVAEDGQPPAHAR